MKKNKRIVKALSLLLSCVFLGTSIAACGKQETPDETPAKPNKGKYEDFQLGDGDKSWALTSTDGKLAVNVYYYKQSMVYDVSYDGKEVVKKSSLGLKTDMNDFTQGLSFVGEEENQDVEISYTTITGKKTQVETEYNELIVSVEKDYYYLDVIMRAYNDGFAFRYNLKCDYADSEIINEEASEFSLPTGAHVTFQQANEFRDYFSYEENYITMLNSEKSGLQGAEAAMPVLYKTPDDVWALLTESDLYGHDYIGSFLAAGRNDGVLKTVPAYGSEEQVRVSLPFESPWRLGIVGGLDTVVESTLVEDVYGEVEYWKPDNYDELSEEEKEIYNYDWVTPGAAAWDWLMNQNTQNDYDMHLEYLDFALENNLKWIILDGGWQPGSPENIKKFKHLVNLAHENGIKVMVWGWGHKDGNENTIIETLDKWQAMGIDGLKLDYFDGQSQDTTDRVESQNTLKITERLYQECAKRKMVLNCHGCNKPTGERRIYPHVFNREGIRGNENLKNYSIYDMVNFPYIRGTIGPADYTPTLVPTNHEESTIGSQMAMHILLETGSISLADNLSTYNDSIAKDFIVGLPDRFDDVKFLSGYVNESCVLMRRAGNEYYVAGITLNSREFTVDLSFLESGKEYVAEIYYDEVYAPTDDVWSPIVPLRNALPIEEWTVSIETGKDVYKNLTLYKRSVAVTSGSTLSIDSPDKGGFAIKIVEKN